MPPADLLPLASTFIPFRSVCLSGLVVLASLLALPNAAHAQIKAAAPTLTQLMADETERAANEGDEAATHWLRPGVHRQTVEEWLGESAMASAIPSLGRTRLVYPDGSELLFFRERLISITPGADAAGIAPDGLSLSGPGEVTAMIDPVLLRRCDPVMLDESLKCAMEQCFIYAPPPGYDHRPKPDHLLPAVQHLPAVEQPARPNRPPSTEELPAPRRPSQSRSLPPRVRRSKESANKSASI